MFAIRKNLCLSILSQRLFSRSSILSMSSHSHTKRHRTSSSPVHRHDSYKNAHQNNTLRRLFQPIDVKPMVSTNPLNSTTSKDTNTNIGLELTGGKTLDRSTCGRDERIVISMNDFRCFAENYYGFLSTR